MTRMARIPIVTAGLAILAIAAGIVGRFNFGGICSVPVWVFSITDPLGFLLRYFDLWRLSITLTCPLGFLERALATKSLLPLWWLGVGVVVLSVILLGRVFCGWLCPAGLVHRLSSGKRGRRPPTREIAAKESTWASYSSYAVLGGVLLASFVFQFPVFCFFCPVGLSFGVIYAVVRLFSSDPLSVELVLFPIMLGLELWVLKSWCRSFCPLGALLSLIGNLNHLMVPVLKKEKCLTSQGINCGACARVCPEGIDLTKKRLFSPNSCTKCLQCSDRCPVKAIEIRLWA
jgi:ferredoxin-type protein NapH